MKKELFILTAAAMLFAATTGFASDPIEAWNRPGEKIKLLSNEEFFSKADYIIEIKSAGWEYIICYDAGGNYNPDEIYTSALFIVTHVYKNNETMRISPGDTLNYIRKGGRIVTPPSEEHPFIGETIYSPRPVDYDTGERGSAMSAEGSTIYFMKKSGLPENPDVSKRNKYPKVSMLQDIVRASIKIGGDSRVSRGPVWGLNDLRFENRYELYKYMEQFEGVDVPLSDANFMRWHSTEEVFNQYLKERNVQDPRTPQYIDSLNRMIEIKSQKIKEYREKKKSEQGVLRATQANNILTVTIKNQRVTYDHDYNKYYFHFDVYAGANNSSTYLDYFSFRLNYNTNAFNTTGNSWAYNGATFDSYTYTSIGYFDVAYNELVFSITAKTVTNLSRTQLTTTPVELLKVKIELKNGLTGVLSGINLDNVGGAWFTTASNTPYNDYGNHGDYDETYFNNPPGFTIYTVAPTLSNFTPTTIHAGVEEILTINGTNFGTQKGEVLFTRAGIAQGTTDYLKGLDELYIDSWSNNQITVRVPSFVRKGYFKAESNEELIGHGSGAGSGKIKVRTARNDESVPSAVDLNIEYSVTNFTTSPKPDSNPICRVYLARLSNCHDMVFTLHNSFNDPTKAAAISAIETALQTWSNLLGIRLVLEKNSSKEYVYAPNFATNAKNIIGFSSVDANGDSFSAMSTNTTRIAVGIYAANYNDDCHTYYRGYGSHIYIREKPVLYIQGQPVNCDWAYQTSGQVNNNKYTSSFYEGILHEIGHVLNLNHVNNTGDLMYYTLNAAHNYTVTNLTPTPKSIVGAQTTAAASKNIEWQVPNIGTLGTLGNNCGDTGIHDYVAIQDPESGRCGVFITPVPPLPANTYIISPGSPAYFHAKFTSESYPCTYVETFDWLMVLYRSDGTEYVYAQLTGVRPNTYIPNNYCGYDDGYFWQPTLGALPPYDWLYDSSGNIYGIVKVTAYINDEDIKSDQKIIGVVPTTIITGPKTVCCDGSEFILTNPPPGTIYWTVSNTNIFNVSPTGNPTTVTRIGSGYGNVTLSAYTGSPGGTLLATKTITPCTTTRTFSGQTINAPLTVGACDIILQDVTVNAELTIRATGVITIQDNVVIGNNGKLILETLNGGRVVIDDKFDLSSGGFEVK